MSPFLKRIALLVAFTVSLVFGLMYALGLRDPSIAYELEVIAPGHIKVTYPKDSLTTSRKGQFFADADGDGYPDLFLSYVKGTVPRERLTSLGQVQQFNRVHSGKTGELISTSIGRSHGDRFAAETPIYSDDQYRFSRAEADIIRPEEGIETVDREGYRITLHGPEGSFRNVLEWTNFTRPGYAYLKREDRYLAFGVDLDGVYQVVDPVTDEVQLSYSPRTWFGQEERVMPFWHDLLVDGNRASCLILFGGAMDGQNQDLVQAFLSVLSWPSGEPLFEFNPSGTGDANADWLTRLNLIAIRDLNQDGYDDFLVRESRETGRVAIFMIDGESGEWSSIQGSTDLGQSMRGRISSGLRSSSERFIHVTDSYLITDDDDEAGTWQLSAWGADRFAPFWKLDFKEEKYSLDHINTQWRWMPNAIDPTKSAWDVCISRYSALHRAEAREQEFMLLDPQTGELLK